MDNKNDILQNGHDFKKNVIKIIKKYYEDKLPDFIEYCIYTNNTQPIMETIYIMSVNKCLFILI